MSEFGSFILFALFVVLLIFLLWFFIFKVKHLKTPDVYMVDGGVKTGKSLVSVKLAITQYWKNLIRYYLRLPFIKLINHFRKKHNSKKNCTNIKSLIVPEKPMLYSNMPLFRVKFNYLSLDILEMKVRCPNKSVFLLDEASLIADSMTAFGVTKLEKEHVDYVNEKLTLWLKIGVSHGGKGSTCIYNSQNVSDLHFSFRRCTSTYLMIYKNRKFPFFCLLQCRELIHDESNDVVNTQTQDIDDDSKPLFVSKRWYKYYDRYYLYCLFKNLPILVNYDVKKLNRSELHDLENVLTFSKYKMIADFNNRKDVKEVVKL